MSDTKHIDDFQAMMEEEKDLEIRQTELRRKRMVLEEARLAVQMDKHLKTEEELIRAKSISYTVPTIEYLQKLQLDNEEYMEAAKHNMIFINKERFMDAIPYFRKNLIFIGAKTGEGKSTAVANIILSTVSGLNPTTGRPRRVLVCSNEEKAEDVYNRVTCLVKGWAYTNHDKFTAEQRQVLKDYMEIWMKLGLMVIDDGFGGVPGNTTTIEGARGIFENLMADPTKFDAVIWDYYQNVAYSKRDPMRNQYQVQEEFSNLCDQYKNLYPAPIVVVGQCKPPDAQETPFEIRVKGSKSISVRATITMEMIADRKMRRTLWVVHKSRFTDAVGQSFYTGYDRGKFVPYTPEFQAKALAANERQDEQKWNKKAGQAMAENMINREKDNGSKKENLEEAGVKGEEVQS